MMVETEPSAPRPKGKGPRGRKKEKAPLSVRIDEQIHARLKRHADLKGERLTDTVERAIHLLLEKETGELPLSHLVRFLILHATPAEQKYVVQFLAFLRMPEKAFGRFHSVFRTTLLETLAVVAQDQEHINALDSYRRRPLE